jgi:carboxyl-terminal processing protease
LKTSKKYIPLLFFSALAAGVFIGGKLQFSSGDGLNNLGSSKNKLNKLIDLIEREYVDDVNTDSIVDLTVNGILEKLDPHSVYIAKNELELVNQSMRGDFVGIGVNFYMYKDSVAVIKPIEGGPSEKAGILSGDRILFANKTQLFGKKLPSDSLFHQLKGVKNSEVELTIFRKSENKIFKTKLKRNVIPIKSVDIAFMVQKGLGYIKINRFAETTYDEFIAGLSDLKKKGAQSVVIDLRDNGGGYLEKAVQIADEFLSKDDLIVFTKNRKGRIDRTLATSKGIFEKGKVFILINENSASASEILAGAIQDQDRGVIVGRRSFGKGLVQREMPLGDGSAVRLTTARYYTPSGRSIQKPYEGDFDAYYKDFGNRFENGELYERDSIQVADSLKFKTAKGRIVYGGGGIVPDVFVPLEGKHGDEAVEIMMQTGLTSYFVFEQLDLDRKVYENLPYENFLNKINQDIYFEKFKEFLEESKFSVRLNTQKPLVKRYILAEFARQLFGEKAYFEILIKEDLMMKKVIENLNNKTFWKPTK